MTVKSATKKYFKTNKTSVIAEYVVGGTILWEIVRYLWLEIKKGLVMIVNYLQSSTVLDVGKEDLISYWNAKKFLIIMISIFWAQLNFLCLMWLL